MGDRQAEVEDDRVAFREDARRVEAHRPVAPDLMPIIHSEVVDVVTIAQRGSQTPPKPDGKKKRGCRRQSHQVPMPERVAALVEKADIGYAVVGGRDDFQRPMQVEVIYREDSFADEAANIDTAQRRAIAEHEATLAFVAIAQKRDPPTLRRVVTRRLEAKPRIAHPGIAPPVGAREQRPSADTTFQQFDHRHSFAPFGIRERRRLLEGWRCQRDLARHGGTFTGIGPVAAGKGVPTALTWAVYHRYGLTKWAAAEKGNVSVRAGCYVIAEAGINHNGSIKTAFDLVDAAADAGCDAVKFQKRTVEKVYSADELGRLRPNPFGETNGDLKRGLELDVAAYERLFAKSASRGIDCLASVWDETSVEVVAALRPRFLKMPSPLIRHTRLLAACRQSGIPVILSTGGADLEAVREAVRILGDSLSVVMHCVSAYPCPDDQVNLRQMVTLSETFGLPVGYSSHDLGPHAVWAAVALGAIVIERHITLDRGMWGSDQAMSTEPAGLLELVQGVRAIETVLGSPDVVTLPAEGAAIAKLARAEDVSA